MPPQELLLFRQLVPCQPVEAPRPEDRLRDLVEEHEVPPGPEGLHIHTWPSGMPSLRAALGLMRTPQSAMS